MVDLDLAASAEIAPGVSLVGLTIGLGTEFFRFSEDHEASLFQLIEQGTVKRIAFEVDWDVDLSGTIYYQMLAPSGEVYWDSTPLTLHEDDFDRFLFADRYEAGSTDFWTNQVN